MLTPVAWRWRQPKSSIVIRPEKFAAGSSRPIAIWTVAQSRLKTKPSMLYGALLLRKALMDINF
jgi:3-isopropylmalate dehydratase small subunit